MSTTTSQTCSARVRSSRGSATYIVLCACGRAGYTAAADRVLRSAASSTLQSSSSLALTPPPGLV